MPHEEIRKIIRVGNSLAVTLPKSWLKFYKLTDQDRVTIFSNGKITIEPRGSMNER